MIKKNRFSILIVIGIIFLTLSVSAEECGLDGMTTSSNTSTTNCNNNFYCCDNKVYNTCGWPGNLPPSGMNCRMISGYEIEQYQSSGICTCGCSENAACYQNKTTNEYVWGKYAENSKYRKVAGISSFDDCNNFCWKSVENGENKYAEGIKAPTEGEWTKVGKVGEVTCSETPACYEKSGNYYVGKYNGITGYTKISDDVTKCNKIVIRKVDSAGKQLSAGEITITKPDKSTVTQKIGSFKFDKLEAGTYKIKEIKAPDGYQLDSTEITFTVANDGKITVDNSSNIYSRSTSATLNAKVYIKNSLLESVCWIKVDSDGNKYKESPTSPGEGWTKVEKENCSENPACYDNGDKYVWGTYENISGYTKIASITEEDKCVKPVPACYKHKTTGKYSWGLYQDNSSYELVPNVLEEDCHEVVPAPKTASNISTTLLVTMVLASIAGVGIIIYANRIKQVN